MEPPRGVLDWSRRTDTTTWSPGLVQEDGYHRGESWTGAGGRIPPRGVLDWCRRTDTTAWSPGLEQEDGYHRGESWTAAGGRMDDEEDRGQGQHAGDDTEG